MEDALKLDGITKEILFLKKEVAMLRELMKEDLGFIRRTEEAWQSYDRGEFISKPADEFLDELEKC